MERRDYSDKISEFVMQLYHKGYRDRFFTDRDKGRPGYPMPLSDCLKGFLKHFFETGQGRHSFGLTTYVASVSASNRITCKFDISFHGQQGFQVREMNIHDARSGEQKHYRLRHNGEIPGSISVQGLFPKPKPWENLLKGKFRL